MSFTKYGWFGNINSKQSFVINKLFVLQRKYKGRVKVTLTTNYQYGYFKDHFMYESESIDVFHFQVIQLYNS